MIHRRLAVVPALMLAVYLSAAAEPERPARWAQPVQAEGVPNLHKVSDRLYRSAQPTAEGMRNLKQRGVKTVVNLRSFHSDRKLLRGTDLGYEHIYMKAWHPEEKEVVRFLRILNDPERTPVLVHCQHGADRTGTMCALYRIAVEGWTKQDALREMTEGGYGFHEVFQNLPEWIEKLDIDAVRRKAGLAEPAAAPDAALAPPSAPTAPPALAANAAEEPKDSLPPAPPGKEWKLVWRDEFDGKTLDDAKWETPPDAPRRDGWWMRKAVELDGQGHLVMRTLRDGDRYVDGCVQTRGRLERAFGYYVMRAKMPSQPGHWPAFWLYGPTVGNVGQDGRDGTEIDIMEKPTRDEKVEHNLHWDGYGEHHQCAGHVSKNPGVMEGFHAFALLWTPEEYVFYVDGKETWRTKAGGVCQAPLYIMISDEIGKWAGDIAKAKLPDELVVDYVRVWDLVEKKAAQKR